MAGDFFYDKPAINDSVAGRMNRILTSLVVILVAFILSSLLYRGMEYLLCYALGYKVQLFFTHVNAAPRELQYWGTIRVLLIYGAPSLVLFFIANVIMKLLNTSKGIVNLPRLVWVWIAYCLSVIFINNLFTAVMGFLIPDSLFYGAFAIVFMWLGVPKVLVGLLIIPGVLLGIAWGYFYAHELLRFSFSSKLIMSLHGRLYVWRQLYLYPLFIFFPAMLAIVYPAGFLPYLFFIFPFLFIGIGTLLRYYNDTVTLVACNKKDVLNKVPVVGLLVLAVLLVFIKWKL